MSGPEASPAHSKPRPARRRGWARIGWITPVSAIGASLTWVFSFLLALHEDWWYAAGYFTLGCVMVVCTWLSDRIADRIGGGS